MNSDQRIQSHGQGDVTDSGRASENAEGALASSRPDHSETTSPAQPEGGAAVAASSSSSPVLTDERATFEAWAIKAHGKFALSDPDAGSMWSAWQARAALQASAHPTAAVVQEPPGLLLTFSLAYMDGALEGEPAEVLTHWARVKAAASHPARSEALAAPPIAAEVEAVQRPASAQAVTDEMVAAYLKANDAYWKRTDDLPRSPIKWRNGSPAEATAEGLRAVFALAQAPAQPSDGVPSGDGGATE